MNNVNKRILLISDAYFGDFSGAYVAQIAKKLLIEIGCTVAVYSDEVTENQKEEDGTPIYFRYKCPFFANWIQKKYKRIIRQCWMTFDLMLYILWVLLPTRILSFGQ